MPFSAHDWYQVVKDFAPSVATLTAAISVAGITWYFNKKQAYTAHRATDIAHDRLRFDLFDKTYGIYNAAKEAIQIALDKCDEEKLPDELRPLFVKFEEAQFFFLRT